MQDTKKNGLKLITMMKKIVTNLISVFFMLFLIGNIDAQEIRMTHKDSLNIVLEKYYELNLKVFQEGSTLEDIDTIFNLFTDDFTYVHIKYGGVYTRQDLYNGYKTNLEKGSYNGRIFDIKINNRIIGLKAATVNKSFITKEDNQIKEGNEQMSLFEFRDGKISKIVEYW
jgi:ketosteroid isomerase-like protein